MDSQGKRTNTNNTNTMNVQELLDRVMRGRHILVGKYRNGRVQTTSVRDNANGEKIDRHEVVYAVERDNGFGIVMIYGPLPDGVDPSTFQPPLIRDRRYAFELNRFLSRANGATAQLGLREPEIVN